MRLAGKRLTKEGVIVIIAQQHRTQERNRADARERLFDLIRQAAVRPVPRRATKPPKAQKRKRLEAKKHRAGIKSLRRGKPRLNSSFPSSPPLIVVPAKAGTHNPCLSESRPQGLWVPARARSLAWPGRQGTE